MDELVTFEAFIEFRRAADRAKELAQRHKIQTGVQRTVTGWNVLAPPNIAVALSPSLYVRQVSEEAGHDYDREVDCDGGELELVMEELAQDQEDWARSEEEGWFYGDDE